MGILDRLGRIVRSEVSAARRKASDAIDEIELPRVGPSPSPPRPPADEADDKPADPIRQAYARLEVPPGSDLATVKKAYRQVMRRYHPDRHNGDPEQARIANEVAAKLTEAYDLLVEHLSKG